MRYVTACWRGWGSSGSLLLTSITERFSELSPSSSALGRYRDVTHQQQWHPPIAQLAPKGTNIFSTPQTTKSSLIHAHTHWPCSGDGLRSKEAAQASPQLRRALGASWGSSLTNFPALAKLCQRGPCCILQWGRRPTQAGVLA